MDGPLLLAAGPIIGREMVERITGDVAATHSERQHATQNAEMAVDGGRSERTFRPLRVDRMQALPLQVAGQIGDRVGIDGGELPAPEASEQD